MGIFWAAIRTRHGDILVKKVKRHCSAHGVAAGKIGMSDFFLNGMADHIARVAAARAALPQWLVAEVRDSDQQIYLIRGRLAAVAQAEASARHQPTDRARRPMVTRLVG